MLLKAIHFDVYSESMFKTIQCELEEIICCKLRNDKYSEYKDFLKDIYESVVKGKDLSGFMPSVDKLYKEMVFRKALREIPVYAAYATICIFIVIIFKFPVFH